MSKPKGELFSILSKILVLENILKDLSDSSNKSKKNAIEKRVNEIIKRFITNNFRIHKLKFIMYTLKIYFSLHLKKKWLSLIEYMIFDTIKAQCTRPQNKKLEYDTILPFVCFLSALSV